MADFIGLNRDGEVRFDHERACQNGLMEGARYLSIDEHTGESGVSS